MSPLGDNRSERRFSNPSSAINPSLIPGCASMSSWWKCSSFGEAFQPYKSFKSTCRDPLLPSCPLIPRVRNRKEKIFMMLGFIPFRQGLPQFRNSLLWMGGMLDETMNFHDKKWHLTTTYHEGRAVNPKEFYLTGFACLLSPNTKICLVVLRHRIPFSSRIR